MITKKEEFKFNSIIINKIAKAEAYFQSLKSNFKEA